MILEVFPCEFRAIRLGNVVVRQYRGHPYAFNVIDDAVMAAIADPEFERLAALAAIGGDEWDERLPHLATGTD